jgi:hypothetical protein
MASGEMPSADYVAFLGITSAHELGTADFTELCKVRRPFPKDAGGTRLLSLSGGANAGHAGSAHRRKAEFEEFCRRRFHVTVDSFDYCWREANKVTGVRWDQPGRPSRQKLSR